MLELNDFTTGWLSGYHIKVQTFWSCFRSILLTRQLAGLIPSKASQVNHKMHKMVHGINSCKIFDTKYIFVYLKKHAKHGDHTMTTP